MDINEFIVIMLFVSAAIIITVLVIVVNQLNENARKCSVVRSEIPTNEISKMNKDELRILRDKCI